MVGYIKHHFFVRYRCFDSWDHLNQTALLWLAEEADLRVHGTVKEVVAERFAREAPHLQSLPTARYDTSYLEHRQVGWDSYIEVRGNRYSVPADLAGQTVRVRISLEGMLTVFHQDRMVASHQLQSAESGWVTVPDHHQALWHQTIRVEHRPLNVYEEVGQWK
jgi:hypothetical protein